jgi:solute carrier family 9B (sodium/hydrogen exchanger), member 1/2
LNLFRAVEAAVSPAVVVPNLIVLREKGFGVVQGVPTLVLAVTGIEDAISIAAFGVISSIMFSTSIQNLLSFIFLL